MSLFGNVDQKYRSKMSVKYVTYVKPTTFQEVRRFAQLQKSSALSIENVGQIRHVCQADDFPRSQTFCSASKVVGPQRRSMILISGAPWMGS
jgi:hypothetical protein